MRIRRKTTRCLNCDRTLGEIYNYCPNCGQENNDHRVSFGTFVGDFFSNYFSLDSRIGRSLKPLFVQPGFLTNRFNEGKRKEYVHPLRLYLVASLVFFFLVSLNVDVGTGKDRAELGKGLAEGIFNLDTLNADTADLALNIITNTSLSYQEVSESLREMGQETVAAEVDSINKNWLGQRVFNQGRRLTEVGLVYFVDFTIRNLPLVLLIAMPIYALLLKLFYIRHKNLYVQHLVHTLHLHSFSLLLFSFLFLLTMSDGTEAIDGYLTGIVALLWIIYTVVSFHKVYRQRWLKTVTKMVLISYIYLLVLSFVGVSEVVLSFFLI